MLGCDARMAQFKVSIDFFKHEQTMNVLAAAMAGMVVMESGPGSDRGSKRIDYMRYVVWHPRLPPSHIITALDGRPPVLQTIELEMAPIGKSNSLWRVAWHLKRSLKHGVGILWGFQVDLSQEKALPRPGEEANVNALGLVKP